MLYVYFRNTNQTVKCKYLLGFVKSGRGEGSCWCGGVDGEGLMNDPCKIWKIVRNSEKFLATPLESFCVRELLLRVALTDHAYRWVKWCLQLLRPEASAGCLWSFYVRQLVLDVPLYQSALIVWRQLRLRIALIPARFTQRNAVFFSFLLFLIDIYFLNQRVLVVFFSCVTGQCLINGPNKLPRLQICRRHNTFSEV